MYFTFVSYVSLHGCIVLINFCYTALGLLFRVMIKGIENSLVI